MSKFASLMEKGSHLSVLLVTLGLVVFGVVMIYSSSSIVAMERYGDESYFLKKQFVFAVIGIILMFVLSNLKYETFKKVAYAGIILSVILLVLILIPPFGVKKGGATRWLKLWLFNFQVSELVKVALVLFLAH